MRINWYLDLLWWYAYSKDRITNALSRFLRKWNILTCSSISASFWGQFDSHWSKWAGQLLLFNLRSLPLLCFFLFQFTCLYFPAIWHWETRTFRGLQNASFSPPHGIFLFHAFIPRDFKLSSLASGHLKTQQCSCMNRISWEVGVVWLERSCLLCYVAHLQPALTCKH